MALPVCTIDETGIHKPDYEEVRSWLVERFQAIFGADIYIDPDSQDGQQIAILASAINDTNAMIVQAYNAFSPATARGTGLSSVVKINGMARHLPSYSTVDLRIVGQAGATITDGVATDAAGNRWRLPSSVVIPPDGDITVTATAQQVGAIQALPNTITGIGTPTRGWQLVNNPAAATVGLPVESDAGLRRRQSRTVALPARSLLESMTAAIAGIPGVAQVHPYENDSPAEDEFGVPSHAVSMVVEGGDAALIAQAIAVNKAPGTKTWGDTSVAVVDAYGIPRTIRFYRPAIIQIKATIQLRPLDGFTSVTQAGIRDAVVAAISALRAGEDVVLSRLYGPANSAGSTYNISSILIGRLGEPVLADDVPIAFFENARAIAANVAIQVLR